MTTVILIRKAFPKPHWEQFAEVPSLEEAERVWKQQIKGRGITGMAEFVSPEMAREMLSEGHTPRKEGWEEKWKETFGTWQYIAIGGASKDKILDFIRTLIIQERAETISREYLRFRIALEKVLEVEQIEDVLAALSTHKGTKEDNK